MADPKPLTRDQLAKFLPNPEAIRKFERLFQVAGDLTPTDVATLYRLTQEAAIEAGTAEAKAQTALDLLSRIACSLDVLTLAPVHSAPLGHDEYYQPASSFSVSDLSDVRNVLPAAGNLLIYDGTIKRYVNALLLPGTNVSITNADGAITISVAGAAPTGAAGGVLSGTYPNPGFAVDMATQAELDAHTGNTSNPHSTTAAQVGADPTGTAAAAVAAHVADADPHPQYALETTTYSGTWAPTLTNTLNIAASVATVCQFLRVGNVVHFSGQVQIDPTATGRVQLGVSLPVASNFTSARQAGGTAAPVNSTATSVLAIYAEVTNDTLVFDGLANDATNRSFCFSGSYLIV